MTIYIDRFSTLDDLPRGKRTIDEALRVLHRVGRFSSFEAGEYRWVANLVTAIKADGLATYDSEKIGYPWVAVTLTPKGLAKIGASS